MKSMQTFFPAAVILLLVALLVPVDGLAQVEDNKGQLYVIPVEEGTTVMLSNATPNRGAPAVLDVFTGNRINSAWLARNNTFSIALHDQSGAEVVFEVHDLAPFAGMAFDVQERGTVFIASRFPVTVRVLEKRE